MQKDCPRLIVCFSFSFSFSFFLFLFYSFSKLHEFPFVIKVINYFHASSFTVNVASTFTVTLYGPNKPYQRENFFQNLTKYITSTHNTINREDFNMVIELRDRIGGTICNTHFVGSVSLNKLINTQKLHDTWRKINLDKTEYSYHRNQSNIHSRLDRIYAYQFINIVNSQLYLSNSQNTKPCSRSLPCK